MSCSLGRLILIIVYYYFVQYKYSLYYLQVCYLKATKLEKPDWCQEMQVNFCLNDQAYIAWFTSTRGNCQVGIPSFQALFRTKESPPMLVPFFTTRWSWRWNTIWRTKLDVSTVWIKCSTVTNVMQPWKVDTHNCILLFCSIQIQFILFTSLLFKSDNIGEASLVSGDAR